MAECNVCCWFEGDSLYRVNTKILLLLSFFHYFAIGISVSGSVGPCLPCLRVSNVLNSWSCLQVSVIISSSQEIPVRLLQLAGPGGTAAKTVAEVSAPWHWPHTWNAACSAHPSGSRAGASGGWLSPPGAGRRAGRGRGAQGVLTLRGLGQKWVIGISETVRAKQGFPRWH